MSSDTEIISDQENNENKFQIEEESTYPLNNNIMYQEHALNSQTKATISGTLLFGLQLDSNNTEGIYHKSDRVALESVEISVNKTDYFQINFGSENKVDQSCKLQSVVKAIDQGQISRDSYRDLAAVETNLPQEHSVSSERIKITDHMNQLIKISLVNMSRQNELEEIIEEPDITNAEITQEVIDTVGTGIYRSAKDILLYIVTQLKKKKVLKSSDPTIYLHVFGDGRNVGHKIKHVMVTFMILNHEKYHQHADYHYTTMYPGTENYNTKFYIDPIS
ncbi:hypothetical protein C1645_840922 [Glomus cerebriforme]|uniref:Uncharacterized protein n=1 Tax=Glomus cerebriforme TaxID=658196 RepID=A0A397S072_9GLOM|nr:hypothetical protein C1645_840922 [Glomus cerebriforme]